MHIPNETNIYKYRYRVPSGLWAIQKRESPLRSRGVLTLNRRRIQRSDFVDRSEWRGARPPFRYSGIRREIHVYARELVHSA